YIFFFFSSRRRHTRCLSDWSSDVCSSDLSQFDALMVGLRLERETVLQALVDQANKSTRPNAGLMVSSDLRTLLAEALKHARENRSEERRVGKEGREKVERER